jgi:arabinose-5-phosphate isomerase
LFRNKSKKTKGIITDGQIRRFNQKNLDLHSKKAIDIMTKNPMWELKKISLAVKALAVMNNKKITSLCVYDKK